MALIVKDGYEFSFDSDACGACGARCCRGESGNIWVTGMDIERISGYLKIPAFEFISNWLERKGNRHTLKERISGDQYDCICLNPDFSCRIYPVRPAQCREFPFWEYYKGNAEEACDECPGVRMVKAV